MTEAEWLACPNTDRLFDHLDEGGAISQRKLRLFAVACCRRIVHLCPEAHAFEVALETAELFADGLRPEQELVDADGVLALIERRLDNGGDEFDESDASDARYHAMQAVGQAMCLDSAECPYRYRTRDVVLHVANGIGFESVLTAPGCEGTWERSERAARRTLANVVREIFGNSFRQTLFDPIWRVRDVKILARGIYEEKAFDRMPILADALQDAGCDSEELLAHCRDTSLTHVRGCWALDLVLAKA